MENLKIRMTQLVINLGILSKNKTLVNVKSRIQRHKTQSAWVQTTTSENLTFFSSDLFAGKKTRVFFVQSPLQRGKRNKHTNFLVDTVYVNGA